MSRNAVLESREANSELKIVNLLQMEDLLIDQKSIALNRINKKINIMNGKNNLLFTNHKDNKKIIVSDEFAKELIKKAHYRFGHIGVKQTELTLLPYFYNTNFKAFIQKFCKNCSVCIKINLDFHRHLGPCLSWDRPLSLLNICQWTRLVGLLAITLLRDTSIS